MPGKFSDYFIIMKFAIIQTGGKQYIVTEGQSITIEKLEHGEKDSSVVFDKILLVNDEHKISVGTPYLAENKVQGTVMGARRGDKKITFKYHNKTRYRKKHGHRQDYTQVRIENIS